MFKGVNDKNTSNFYIMFDVKCDPSYTANTSKHLNWKKDDSIREKNLIVYKYQGLAGCISKEFRGQYYFNFLFAPIQIVLGVFLNFKGSANFKYTLAILCILTGQFLIQLAAQLINFISLENKDTFIVIFSHIQVYVAGTFLGIIAFFYLKNKELVPRYLA